MRVVLEILAAWTLVSVVFCVGISRALRVMDLSTHAPQARKDAASTLPSDPAPTATAA